ncbi:MAG TPA: hypothetical protein VGR16_01265 [Thermomicrobiales bacterium]|nr:hypothetical protein [Thermomicrobiales bacterium]
MATTQRVGDLEIDEDLAFTRREWTIQRVGWGVMLLIVVAALLGLFGTGPLSDATAGGAEEGLRINYSRFIRHDGESTLELQVDPGQVENGEVEVWIANGYLDAVQVQQIMPVPAEVRAAGDGKIFVFAVADPLGPVSATFLLSPQGIGRLAGVAAAGDGPRVAFMQLIYP